MTIIVSTRAAADRLERAEFAYIAAACRYQVARDADFVQASENFEAANTERAAATDMYQAALVRDLNEAIAAIKERAFADPVLFLSTDGSWGGAADLTFAAESQISDDTRDQYEMD